MGKFGRLFNSMASQLEQSVSKLKASETKYRHLFENSQDCFFVTDSSGVIIDVNRAYAAFLGLSLEDGMRENLFLPWRHQDADEPSMLKKAIHQTGYVKNYEVHLRRSDGTPLICLMTATIRRNRDGAVLGYDGVLRDITERRKRIAARRNFQKRLQEEIVLAEERERHSLGQILHEELAQNLALVHLKIQETQAAIPENEKDLKNSLQGSKHLLNRMIRSRYMSF